MPNNIKVHVFRFDPEVDTKPHYETYEISAEEDIRIIGVLEKLREIAGVEFAFRESCGIARCGTCAVMVNGKPKLACWEPAEKEMTLEPLKGFPVIRDLVVDKSRYYTSLLFIDPVLRRKTDIEPFPEQITDIEFIKQSKNLYSCIECMICMSACPVFCNNQNFLGPTNLWQAYKLIVDPRDSKRDARLAKVTRSVLWQCDQCYECTKACPRGVDAGSAIVSLKDMILRKGRSSRPILVAQP